MAKSWTERVSEYPLVRRVMYFFPVQLIFVHLKNNQFLVLIWFLLISFLSRGILEKYGVPYLFLTPEYLGEVSFISYFFIGFSFGGFIMAFNMSSYIINGHRFPFIATLSRPFYKYFLNNAFWWLSLVIAYLYFSISFLIEENYYSSWDIVIFMMGFVVGFALIITLNLAYFFNTNKDFTKIFGKKADDYFQEKDKPVKGLLHKKVQWDKFFNPDREWTIETYLSSIKKISIARNTVHYDHSMLRKVFEQNHLNAALFEIAIFISIIMLSFGSDVSYFMIPAGASLTLMFTMMIMLTSAIHSWFRGWSPAVMLGLFLVFNYFSQFDFFNPPNKAYGMDYSGAPAEYSLKVLNRHSNPINFRNDYLHTVGIMENWKRKVKKTLPSKSDKPKMIFITTTGGGMRSGLWSFYCTQFADSITDGKLLNQTQLISGSSGGLIGMSYIRELMLRQKNGEVEDLYSNYYSDNLSKDILNRLGFSWTVNDLIFKFRSFDDGDYTYKKDRGYAFEAQLNNNTDNVLDRRLYEYYQPEAKSEIPMLILSPTIVNDGRRLLISPQPISYLTFIAPQYNIKNNFLVEAAEFRRLFKEQDADNLRFTTALRMSSTFPYVMPIAHLPSDPVIEIMDAGIRDNYGTQTMLKYLYTFRNWIANNTSGVIIVQIRDTEKATPTKSNGSNTFLKAVSSPVGSIYGNLFAMQDYDHDQLMQYASEWFNNDIHVIDLVLHHEEETELSMSWHLTEREKKEVIKSIKAKDNQSSLEQLQRLLK